MQPNKTLFLTQFSVLLAIEAVLCFTFLGSLQIGPVVASVAFVPVVIAAQLFGARAGSLMGAFAGLFSLIVWTFMPPSPLTAFLFTPFYSLGELQGNAGSLLICFVPRILVGTVSGLLYQWLVKLFPRKDALCLAVSAAAGALTNTFGFLLGVWLFFSVQAESVAGVSLLAFAITTVTVNGVLEAVISAVASVVICKPVKLILAKR